MDGFMEKNTNDGLDAFAAVVIIGVLVTGITFWLYNMPS
jgi:hypothetical protein